MPASTPATTPLETEPAPPDALELSLEAVAAKELDARVAGDRAVVGVVAAGVEDRTIGRGGVEVLVEVVGTGGRFVVTGAARLTRGDRWTRADVVIEKSITSKSTGLDHITS